MGSEILAGVDWSEANDLHPLSHVTGPRPFFMNVEKNGNLLLMYKRLIPYSVHLG